MSKQFRTDEQLILSISKGSNEAFDMLYSRYERKLMGYIMYKLKNKEIAEELFQVTWTKILKNSHRFDTRKFFAPWLMTIASNTIKDWFKKTTNYQKLLHSYKSDTEESGEPIKSLPDLSFLKQQSQNVLKLKYIEGLNSKEIGKKLNMSEANVRKISSRALKEVKIHIESGGEI